MEMSSEDRLLQSVRDLCRSSGILEEYEIQKIQLSMQEALYSTSPEGVGRVATCLNKINEVASRNLGEFR